MSTVYVQCCHEEYVLKRHYLPLTPLTGIVTPALVIVNGGKYSKQLVCYLALVALADQKKKNPKRSQEGEMYCSVKCCVFV